MSDKLIEAVVDFLSKNIQNESGPFSYGAKKPRQGSVADLADKKRREQEKDRPPIEPKDQMVGTAKVTKVGVKEESEIEEDFSKMKDHELKQWIATRQMNSMGGNLSKKRKDQYDQAQAELKKRSK